MCQTLLDAKDIKMNKTLSLPQRILHHTNKTDHCFESGDKDNRMTKGEHEGDRNAQYIQG